MPYGCRVTIIIDKVMLTFENVSFSRGNILTVKDVNVTLFSGAIVQVMGEGSSDLLRMIASLDSTDDGGRIFYNGFDIRSDLSMYRSQICYISRDNGMEDSLTLRQNIEFFTRIYNCEDKMDFILEAFDLMDFVDMKFKNLSLDIRRRAWLSRILMTSAPVWLIDNLFSDVNSEFKDILGLLIESRRQQRGIIIYSTFIDQKRYLNQVTDLEI